MKRITGFMLYAVIAAALALAVVLPARAQGISGLGPYEGPTKERTRDDSERDLEDRVAYQRLLAARAANRRERKFDPKLALAQLQEDFTHLQMLNKELVLTSSRSADLDLKFVAKSAAEIHKRAERLMSNLELPKPENDPQRTQPAAPADAKQMKASIVALGWLIYRFTKNPIFKEANVVEAESAAKARRDLEEIIELSGQIKKSSEKMK